MPKDEYRYTGFNTRNLNKAKRLRREMTKQERHLWYDFLKDYPVHFYRQRPIDGYIVDFFCFDASLVIELDGEQHGEPEALEYDRIRTEQLKSYGLTVLRFANGDVDRGFEGVCLAIHETVKTQLKQKGRSAELAALELLERSWEED